MRVGGSRRETACPFLLGGESVKVDHSPPFLFVHVSAILSDGTYLVNRVRSAGAC